MKKTPLKPLTQRMSFHDVCKAMNVKEENIPVLWEIINTTTEDTLNQSNRCRNIVGIDNYQLFRKWLYR